MTVRCEKSTRDRARAPAGKPGRSPRSPSPPSNAGQGSGSTRTQGVVTRSVSLGGGTIRPCHARRLNAGSFAPPKGGAGVGFSAAGGPRRGSSTQIARSGKGRARLDVNDLSPKCKEKPDAPRGGAGLGPSNSRESVGDRHFGSAPPGSDPHGNSFIRRYRSHSSFVDGRDEHLACAPFVWDEGEPLDRSCGASTARRGSQRSSKGAGVRGIGPPRGGQIHRGVQSNRSNPRSTVSRSSRSRGEITREASGLSCTWGEASAAMRASPESVEP